MKNADNEIAVVILAAGLGSRMKSRKAKVLHELLGRSMILYVVDTARCVAGDNVILVVGHQADEVRKFVSARHNVTYAHQEEQLGTGHAVLTALPYIPASARQVVILYGDVPLLLPQTIFHLMDEHVKAQHHITILGVKLDIPTGYGRLLTGENGRVLRIVEEADATDRQKQIKAVNPGIYCIERDILKETLCRVTPQNVQGELYLTDIVEIGNNAGLNIGVVFTGDSAEIIGVNTLQDLERAERLMRKRLCKRS